jgi:hypothetical protein
VTLVGPISRASIECFSLSGDELHDLEAWTFELVPFSELVTRCIGTMAAELERQLGDVSPF